MQERRERLLQEPRTAEQARDLLRGLERLLQEASFVLLVYRRLLLRGWLIREWLIRGWLTETTTGFAFFRRCPRLPSRHGRR
jgi:hypothetical protein